MNAKDDYHQSNNIGNFDLIKNSNAGDQVDFERDEVSVTPKKD